MTWSVDGPAKEEVGKEKLVAAPVQLVVSVLTKKTFLIFMYIVKSSMGHPIEPGLFSIAFTIIELKSEHR